MATRSPLSQAGDAAADAVHEVAPWIERLARLGFLAKAVLYVTIGALAALAALGEGGQAGPDSRGAMVALLRQPYGRALLGVIALGLFGYALWRIVEGITDPEGRGHGARGLALRARSLATAVLHGGLGYSALLLALGTGSGRGGGPQARHWTAQALATPGGITALYLVAAAFITYGAYQLVQAARSKLARQLALGRLSARARAWVVGTSRVGIAARGVVFGMVGVLLARATARRDPSEAGGIGDSLRELVTLGRWPFAAVAVGLIAYGVYQAINARYRRIAVG